MKIAGIAGKKHPTLKRGEAIPFTPEKKVETMAKEALVDTSPEGYMYIPMTSELIGSVQIINGRLGLKNPEPNQYSGTCLVKYRTCKLDTDKVFSIKERKIKVHCEDSKNDIGIEDLKLLSSSVVL